MNTTLSAAAGGLTFLLRLRTGRKDLAGMCNGILAGLVAVCACLLLVLIAVFIVASHGGGRVLRHRW